MTKRWLQTDCDFDEVDRLLYSEPDFKEIGYNTDIRSRVLQRLQSLTIECVDNAFSSLPATWVALHDGIAPSGRFLCAPMKDKVARLKSNVSKFVSWAK